MNQPLPKAASLSILIPVYNEETLIEEQLRRVATAWPRCGTSSTSASGTSPLGSRSEVSWAESREGAAARVLEFSSLPVAQLLEPLGSLRVGGFIAHL